VRIHLFTSAGEPGDTAHAFAEAQHPEHRWRRLLLDTPEKRAAWEAEPRHADLIISFLNPYILPAADLEATGGRAYNVHPSTPEYPGNDSPFFAAWDGRFVAGATLHRMEPRVDSGEIYDVCERPTDPTGGVVELRVVSRQLALGILLRNLRGIVEDTLVPNGQRWALANKRTRADFLEMCRIDPSIDEADLDRRLTAFYHPGNRTRPYVELHGRRFVYEPTAGR